jgi:hypothetical protein
MKIPDSRTLFTCVALAFGQALVQPAIAAEPLVGEFGGDRTNASFGTDSAQLDLDCATAEIRRGVRIDADGRFEARGLYVEDHIGPIDGEAATRAVEVTFVGLLRDDRIDLTISIAGHGNPERLTLKRGHRVNRVRCLSSGQEVRGKPRLAESATPIGRETLS